MRKLAFFPLAAMLNGCMGTAYYPGQPRQQASFGWPQPYQSANQASDAWRAVPGSNQSYQQQPSPQASDTYTPSRMVEHSYIVPEDTEWCRRPGVAEGLLERHNQGLAESARRGHEMAVGYGIETPDAPVSYNNVATAITDLTASTHGCYAKPGATCDDSAHVHVCRGLVHLPNRSPIPVKFTIRDGSLSTAIVQRDDAQ